MSNVKDMSCMLSKSLYTGQLLTTKDTSRDKFLEEKSKSLYTGQLLTTLPFTFPFVKTNYYIECANMIKINLKIK